MTLWVFKGARTVKCYIWSKNNMLKYIYEFIFDSPKLFKMMTLTSSCSIKFGVEVNKDICETGC